MPVNTAIIAYEEVCLRKDKAMLNAAQQKVAGLGRLA